MSVEFSPKLKREHKTVQAMINLYCRRNHNTKNNLCEKCTELQRYAFDRLNNCKFKDNKHTFGKCTIHCYKPSTKKDIQEVMRYSGPRMIFHHPFLAIYHLLDEFIKKSGQQPKSK